MRKVSIGIVVAVAAVTAAWWLYDPRSAVEVKRGAATPVPAARMVEPQVPMPSRQAPTVAPAPSDAEARVRAYQERLAFHEQTRAFFAEAANLPPEVRDAQAHAIARTLARYEQAGEIAAAEALLIRIALIRETTSDPAEQQAAIAALQEHYYRESQRRLAEAARPDPAFERYKEREREIVAQVQAMETIPHGLTRDQYLRQLLQEERERLLGSGR